jgi:hypothetical protein
MTFKTKQELKTIMERARAEHKRIFGEELSIGELNHFFSSVLEFKRRKWLEAALSDHPPEEIMGYLEVLDEGQVKGDGKAE